MDKKLMGRYIVTNPNICHGKPVFRGTRVFVSDVLDQVASGMAWETIIEALLRRQLPRLCVWPVNHFLSTCTSMFWSQCMSTFWSQCPREHSG